MLKREHVLMICVGVLLLSCVYLLWDNKRLKKRIALKPQEVVVNKQTPEPEPEAEPEATEAEPEATEAEPEANNGMDYYVNENIPDDLKEELNNLNLEDDGESNEEIHDEPLDEIHDEPLEEIHGEPLEEIHGEPLEEIHGEPLEEIHGEPLEEIHGEPLEEMHGEMMTNQIDDFVEEIMIDTKPEDSELLDLELQLEHKIKSSLEKVNNYTEESLNAMNLKQLADVCRENNLKIKGKKSEIVERILSM